MKSSGFHPDALRGRLTQLSREAGFQALSVAVYDFGTAASFELEASRWHHAASVIKVAVLLAVFKAAEQGIIDLNGDLHVRNRFRSVVDGSLFRVEGDRDGDAGCYRMIGRTMKIADLARAMIVRSSNLATNLLLEILGIGQACEILNTAGLHGVKLIRGVEDHLAFERAINNELTAAGTVQMLRLCHEEGFLNAASRQHVREILLAQEFNSMIPAGLPPRIRVAHKTGEISSHCHDAGIVFLPDRAPYAVAILSQSSQENRSRTIARISAEIFEVFSR